MRAVLFMMVASVYAGLGACVGSGDDTTTNVPVLQPEAGVADASKGLDATARGDGTGGDANAADSAADADAYAGEDGSTPTLALLRFANWSAGAPAVDFCLAPHGTGAFKIPVLGTSAAAIDEAGVIDAGSGALPFPKSTAYLLVDPAQYDARLVAGGSSDCSAKIAEDATSLPALASGAAGTIALVGATQPRGGEPGLRIVGFLDDLQSNLATAFELRAINAAPDLPKVDVGTLSGGLFQSSFVGVPFGASSAGIANVGRSSPDSNGYVPVTLLVNAVLAASPSIPPLLDGSAGSIVAQTSPINVGLGAVVTVAVVGASGQTATQIVECVDNGGTAGLAGNCQVVSQ
jgi:hypothetical protein